MLNMLRKMGSFRSYVGLEEYEMKQTSKSDGEGEHLQPEFLNGELIISEALNVLKFTSFSKKKGLSGSLFVTNARVVFVSSDNLSAEDSVPLLSINLLWYYENPKGSTGAKKHRRIVKLGPSSINNPNLIPSGSIRVHEILIACSNFKTARFSFKFSPIDHGLRVCNAIIHHAFPVQLERLFYFDYSKVTSSNWRQAVCQSTISVPSYLEKGDWLKEMNITRCNSGYRISNANEDFQLCGSLPEWIVVPADLTDVRLRSLAEKLKGCRPPHWGWGDAKGSGILRMSKLNSENDSSAENAFFELLRKTHPKKRPPEIIDLDRDLPTKEIKLAFNKLFELCCPETYSQYEETDNRFYSLLEHTKWMFWISRIISIANSAVNLIVTHQDLIIVQEQESRDTSCLCSSVIQVMVDARFRTVTGFFSLIQKEWIAFGHPFHSSYMHASPIFLMFLDTVQQLMKQNPVEFEFNDKLLAHIWDSCFDSTRGTFLFDTPQQRRTMDRWNEYTAWGGILAKDVEERVNHSVQSLRTGAVDSKLAAGPNTLLPRTLMNPMYKLKTLLYPPTASLAHYYLSPVLLCSSCMCDLQFWRNLYLSRTYSSSLYLVGGSATVSKPILPVDQNNAATSTPTSKSPGSTSSFIFPSNSSVNASDKFYAIGRDPSMELKVVNLLLAALSSSTRYHRNPAGASNSGSTGGNSMFREKLSNSPGYNQQKTDGKRRRNPFSHM